MVFSYVRGLIYTINIGERLKQAVPFVILGVWYIDFGGADL
jgi:hypothetical protein